MSGAAELAADSFGTGVRIGSPVENVGGLSDAVDSPRFATVVGLAQYGAHRLHLSGATARVRGGTRAGDGQVDRFAKRVKDWLQDFF